MSALAPFNREEPHLSAGDARALIQHLVDPSDSLALLQSCSGEQRLRILLYILRQVGFQASGVKAMVKFNYSTSWEGRPLQFTDVYAIAIREGPVAEMFSLHKKTKIALTKNGVVTELVAKGVNRLSALRADPGVHSIFWEEIYPEPMKQKDLLGEINASPGNHRATVANLLIIAERWQLNHCTVAAPGVCARPRL